MPGESVTIAVMTEQLPQGNSAEGHDAALSSLVERARAGDAAAFEQLMVCTERRVAATAWRILGNREDARDALQEIFLRLYKYLGSYRPGQDFHGWLYRITVNVCRDMLRGGRGMKPPPGAALVSSPDEDERTPLPRDERAGGCGTEEAALLTERRAIIGRALATLPEKERTAIVLRDLEGRTTEEVARLMKTRPATVRSQVSTARTKLRLYCERLLRQQVDAAPRKQ